MILRAVLHRTHLAGWSILPCSQRLLGAALNARSVGQNMAGLMTEVNMDVLTSVNSIDNQPKTTYVWLPGSNSKIHISCLHSIQTIMELFKHQANIKCKTKTPEILWCHPFPLQIHKQLASPKLTRSHGATACSKAAAVSQLQTPSPMEWPCLVVLFKTAQPETKVEIELFDGLMRVELWHNRQFGGSWWNRWARELWDLGTINIINFSLTLVQDFSSDHIPFVWKHHCQTHPGSPRTSLLAIQPFMLASSMIFILRPSCV